jgi:hypothetical protein
MVTLGGTVALLLDDDNGTVSPPLGAGASIVALP